MNTLRSISRLILLVALCSVSFLLLCAEEADTPLWPLHFLADKCLGMFLAVSVVRLCGKWGSKAPFYKAYRRLLAKVTQPFPDTISASIDRHEKV